MKRQLKAALSLIALLLLLASGAFQAVPAHATVIVGATAIAAGNDNTCAVTTIGGVKCWGWNGFGQLGDGSTSTSTIPVDTTLISSNATDIAVGYSYSCAVVSGGAKCWGVNDVGQLGDNSTTNRSSPVDVYQLGSGSGVTDIAANAGYHTCAVVSGAAKCWGKNYWGQLGNNPTMFSNTTNSSIPVQVDGLTSGIVAVAAGGAHSCALTSGGAVKCWGQNTYGQLGNGNTTSSGIPVTPISSGAVAISAGDINSCAVLSTGEVKCWGQNYVGQLGNGYSGSGHDSNVPVLVTGISNAVQSRNAIATGGAHSCTLVGTGGVRCWGYNGEGELGNNSTVNSSLWVTATGILTATAITASSGHTCAVLNDGITKCWGDNSNGKLGDNTSIMRTTPKLVSVLGPDAFQYPIPEDSWEDTHGFDRHPDFSGSNACFGVDYNQTYHTGYDIGGTTTTDVFADAAGTVLYSSKPGQGGTTSYPGGVVIIRHTLPDSSYIYSMFGHLDASSITVNVNDVVTKGQKIADGLVLQTYTSGGNTYDNTHLHWEIRLEYDLSAIKAAPNHTSTCASITGPGYSYDSNDTYAHPTAFTLTYASPSVTFHWYDPKDYADTH